MRERIQTYRNTLILGLIALPLGLAIGAIDALFGRVLLALTAFRMEHAYYLLPFLGLVGVVIVWCYQKVGGTSGKGMTLLFEAGHGDTQDIPLRLIPLVMVSTWLTHLFGGSAGREGVAVQIGGTLAHGVGKHLPIPNAGRQLLIAGMAAGFAGLFRTPIAATFFALEVLTAGVLEYSALLPALVASFSASACSGLLGLEKFTVALTDQVAFSAPLVGKLLLFGLLFGLVGDPQFSARNATTPIPVIGRVTAGQPILAEENVEEYIPIPEAMLGDGTHFILLVKGESMIQAGIMDGDYVVVRKQPEANNGDIVVAMIEDSATVKRFYKENGHFRLQPENPTMEPIYTKELTILGKVVSLYRIL